jgi:hypothetical protein
LIAAGAGPAFEPKKPQGDAGVSSRSGDAGIGRWNQPGVINPKGGRYKFSTFVVRSLAYGAT